MRVALALLVLMLSGTVAAEDGAVVGTVKFEGPAPTMKPIGMGADPVCHHHNQDDPVKNEALVLGEGQTMGNIFVEVTGGRPEKEHPVPEEPAVLTQKGCVYSPHVFVVRAGQPLKVLNPDETLHNVNGMPEKNPKFNKGMPKTLKEITIELPNPEPMFTIKCDVHPWMRSYCAVLDHPYYDVTEKDGKYRIEGLPAGEYTITAWHEKLGPIAATVSVPEGGEAKHDFAFSRPKR